VSRRPSTTAGDAAALAKDAEDWRKRVGRRARKANLDIAAAQLALHASDLALLSAWNARMNLTALRDRDEAVDRLILEPVAAARLLGTASGLIDIGSGGGSPAIPLRIQMPSTVLCMVESKIKKGAFLREVIRRLDLVPARVESRRFEELLTDAVAHEAYDLVSIRAVRIQPSTLAAAQAFLKPGGRLALFRGPGEDPPPSIPMLAIEADEPLIESLRSRLVILRKLLPL
jgi:16S rRNA (guanine527-N7)-methyltransferase